MPWNSEQDLLLPHSRDVRVSGLCTPKGGGGIGLTALGTYGGCCNSVSGRESGWSQSSQGMNSWRWDRQTISQGWSAGSSLRAGCTGVMLPILPYPQGKGPGRECCEPNRQHRSASVWSRAVTWVAEEPRRQALPLARHAAAGAVLLRAGPAGVLPSLVVAQAPGWAGADLPVTLRGRITNLVDLQGANSHHLPFTPDPTPQAVSRSPALCGNLQRSSR